MLCHHGAGEVTGAMPSASTIYRIASMSKSFTAATLLILAERGVLSLEDTVRTWVPEFPDYRDDAGVSVPVRLWMLLANCAGLPEDNAWADQIAGADEEFLRAVLREGLSYTAAPGTTYQYSNLGFAVLGLVVRSATGRPFTEVATTELLLPLGLESTRWDRAALGAAGRLFAEGFESYDDGGTWHPRPVVPTGMMAPAGSLFSSAADIARWSAWLSAAFDPEDRDDAVLSRQARRRMQSAHTLIPSMEARMARPDLDGIGYGLGVIVEHDTRFGQIVQHSGGLPGFGSHMRWQLATGIGVVVLANTNGLPTAQWARDILRTVLERVDAPARTVELWPQTRAALAAVDRAIRETGSLAGVVDLFAENVLADVPLPLREGALAEVIERIGGIAPRQAPQEARLRWSVSPGQVTWRVEGRRGHAICAVELTPTAARRVQRLDVTFGDEPGSDPVRMVAHHYRPRLWVGVRAGTV